MLKRRAKCTLDDGTVRKALAQRKIKFRRFRTKPLLTQDDLRKRFAFAKKFRKKSRSFWLKKIQMQWDLKNFQVHTNAQARAHAAMRMVRVAYREAGEGLDECYVVIPKHMRFNPGARSCRIAGAVGGGRVRLWHEVGRKWNGEKAAELYKGPLLSALKRGWPHKRSWTVLEDNDPTGFKSTKGEAAKRQCKIKVFAIPKRSPDLNVCDYALWKEVSSRMRRQEKTWSRSKKETREQYIDRLKRTATRLPKSFIDNSIADMTRRCQRLYEKKGRYFEEGGRSGRSATRSRR